ncbi:Copia protein [Trachymyrmex cornetzi]|uniref:Copia protein n=1 Tax=Trachymyrmex cornetzi TaxID=471704 RepID=A0A151JBB2_9HYME|nr:Copia protein [Trachymyrmex cornetzi]
MTDIIDLKNVTKFDGTNFQLWKFQIRTILTVSGLMDIVDGKLPKPEAVAESHVTWNAKNAKAMCILSSAVEYSQLEYLITCETAFDMWTKLSSIHEHKSAANKLTLMTKFHGHKMGSSDSVAQHIDVMVMAKIVGTLPSKFNSLITTWDSVSEGDRTKDNLIQRLSTEENRLTNSEATSDALAAVKNYKKAGAVNNANSSETQGTKPVNRDKGTISCHYCHKRGHIEKRCYKKRDDIRNKKEANNSTKEDESVNFGAFMVSKCESASRILADN